MTARFRPSLVAVIFAAVALASQITAQAEPLTYTAFSGSLNQGPPGPAGQYVLGGVTNTFSSDATATFTATADSTAVVFATSSADTGSVPLYYNLVGTITITIVDGATTINFTAGTQNGTQQLAAWSFKDPGDAYSGIGFGAIDVSSPYTTANPDAVGFAYELALGTSFYGDLLASPATFDGPFQLNIVNAIEITSGDESGLLQFFNGGSDPSFTIEPVPEPSTYALVLLGAGAVCVWKRRRGLIRS